jgi:hypothetical protein
LYFSVLDDRVPVVMIDEEIVLDKLVDGHFRWDGEHISRHDIVDRDSRQGFADETLT